jgi:PAS domain S-box-containing protein
MAGKNLASELARALDRNEIVPYYQPIVDLQTRRIEGFELLARWQHPIRQTVSPAEFIPAAEKLGLIGALTERLLRQACAHATNWPAHIQLSVNISSLQLHDSGLPEQLSEIVEQARFPFHRLTFEITESAVVDDLDLARLILGDLRSLGAHLALDDFGTGYSGLHHLQELPFDILKVDAIFVRTLCTKPESRKIIAAVMGLCQTLKLATVAEGIENDGQLEMLRCLGYDRGQGWLFGRPTPAAETETLLKNEQSAVVLNSVAQIAEQVALRLEAMPIQCLWQLKALYEGAPVGLAFLDHELRYLAVNERLAEMHGLPTAAFLGRAVADVFPEGIDTIEPRLRRTLGGEIIKDIKTRHGSMAGRPARLLQSSYQPVRDPAGEVIGVSVAVVDVTDHGPVTAAKTNGRFEPPTFRRI